MLRDVTEADQRAAADDAARKQRIRDTHAAIDVSRQAQLRAKAAAKAAEKAEEAEFVASWDNRVRELKREEDEEKMRKLATGKQLAAFQVRQAAIKARRLADAKIAALQEAAQLALSVQEEEEIFMRYAHECIDEYRRQGKPTVPMELHLRKKTTIETMR